MNYDPRTGLPTSERANSEFFLGRKPVTRRVFPVTTRQATPADILPLIKGGSRPMQRRIVALFN